MAGGEDTGNRMYGEWMKADTHIRADDQRTNQHSPRRRRSELATQTDPSLKISSPTKPINAEMDKPKNKETDTMSPIHTLRTLTQSKHQHLLLDTYRWMRIFQETRLMHNQARLIWKPITLIMPFITCQSVMGSQTQVT